MTCKKRPPFKTIYSSKNKGILDNVVCPEAAKQTQSGSELPGAVSLEGWGSLAHSRPIKDLNSNFAAEGQEMVEAEVWFKSVFSQRRSFL